MMTADDEGKAVDAARQPQPTAAATRADADAPAVGAPGDIHTYIGSRLRQAFDDIASQPIPDRFLELMRDIDKT